MDNKNSIKLFENTEIRSVWDAENEKIWLSVVDVVRALTGTDNPRRYWSDLKIKLQEEGSRLYEKIVQLKLQALDGKMRLTDVADTEQILRIIQSIPSKKAEPFKRWLAEVGAERIDQMSDPEKSIKQALADYKRLGYSDDWINQRLKSIEIRKDLTDSWNRHGVSGKGYASLTDIMYKTWAGMTTREYKDHKNLHKENLRDNMTNGELLMNMLAEYSTTSITESKAPKTYKENVDCAITGSNIAKLAREQLEAKTGRSVVSKLNAEEIRAQKLLLDSEAEELDSTASKNNIAIIRRMRGFSQSFMAEKLGVARQTYINIEKGIKELTISQAETLQEVLQVSFDELLGISSTVKF